MSVVKFLFKLVVIGGFLAGVAVFSGMIWLNHETERPGAYQDQIDFTVRSGEGVAQIARRLETQGMIRDARIFRLISRLNGTDQSIKAGQYVLQPRLSANEILQKLVEGDVVQLRLTIPEGLTTAQIFRRIAASDLLQGDMPEVRPAEGSLLPDTYIFDAGTSRQALIDRMAAAQTRLLADLWPERQADLPVRSPAEAVILASIVEKETGRAEERPLIAGLFTERLRRGMRLESDPTIIYGVSQGEPLLNRRGERRTLYRSEIDRRTDWNTYQIDGLPKTPICNPGREAIEAVLNPPETDYIFFVADGTGGHKFARTYREHQRNVAAYRAYERAEIARERGN